MIRFTGYLILLVLVIFPLSVSVPVAAEESAKATLNSHDISAESPGPAPVSGMTALEKKILELIERVVALQERVSRLISRLSGTSSSTSTSQPAKPTATSVTPGQTTSTSSPAPSTVKPTAGTKPPSSDETGVYLARKHKTLPYRLFLPSNQAQMLPLVIFLHGGGEKGNNNSSQLSDKSTAGTLLVKEPFLSKYPCYILAPQCPSGSNFTYAGPGKGPLGLVDEVVEQLLDTYNIDENRIYVTGLSMGGNGTWEYIHKCPNRFACAVPICGWYNTKNVSVIKNLPIWTFHGTSDSSVNISSTRNLVSALKNIEGNIKYTEVKGGGHGIWKTIYAQDDLYQWMFSQKKQ